MGQRKSKGYLLWIFLSLFLFIGCGKQNEKIEMLVPPCILPDNIPERFLENDLDYQNYPVYEAKYMKKIEEWEWVGEASFEIEKRKEQKGSWIAYYPVFSSSFYPEETKKINENLETYLKSWQETCFEDDDYIYKNELLYMLTFDVLYYSEDEISIVFDFLVCEKEKPEEIWEGGMSYNFKCIKKDILYFAVPIGKYFLYQDSMEEDFDHEKEVSSYKIGYFGENLKNEDGDDVEWLYPQLSGEGGQIEKINADIMGDLEILLEYSKQDNKDENEIARKTKVYYDIVYNDERVFNVLYKYVCYSKKKLLVESEDYEVTKSQLYSVIYDLDTGERIRYEDLLDSSQIEALVSLLHTIYSRKDQKIDRIFYADTIECYLGEDEIHFLGYNENKLTQTIVIPYIIAKQAKTDHPIWDWLLKTEKGGE